MGSLRYWNISHHGQWQIERALEVLRCHAPAHHAHVLGVIEGVKYLGGDGCGTNAIACTAGPHGRWIVLTSPPESSALVELAITLSHEARHYAFDIYGRLVEVAHTCRDCWAHHERSRDPIYQEDERLRSHLTWALTPQQPIPVAIVPAWQRAVPAYPAQAQWVPAAPEPTPNLLPLAALALLRPAVPPEAVAFGLLGLALSLAAASQRRR